MTTSRFKLGPGILVTAAFIGPGTVTTASIAGASYGFVLGWALLFSIIATFVLQEMSARLGIATGKGLAENLRSYLANHWAGKASAILVVLAIGAGNAAYQAGNLTGGAIGLSSTLGGDNGLWSIILGLIAGALLWLGRSDLLIRVMLFLVIAMSVVFLLTFLLSKPDFSAVLSGLLSPNLPAGSILTILALIGTTVVPYNLFLHSSTVAEQNRQVSDKRIAIKHSRLDTGVSIGLGGLITLSVMGTAAAAFHGTGADFSATTMAQQLEPLLGSSARYFFAAGFLAAGLSSAIAAPLAAGYAVTGILGWSTTPSAREFRIVSMIVLACGTLIAATGSKPLTAIVFAQAANGFLLPVVAIFLMVVTSQKKILGSHVNSRWSTVLGGIVVAVAVGLGALKIVGSLGII